MKLSRRSLFAGFAGVFWRPAKPVEPIMLGKLLGPTRFVKFLGMLSPEPYLKALKIKFDFRCVSGPPAKTPAPSPQHYRYRVGYSPPVIPNPDAFRSPQTSGPHNQSR